MAWEQQDERGFPVHSQEDMAEMLKSRKAIFNSISKLLWVFLTSKMGLFFPKVDLDDLKCLEVAR